MTTELKFYPHRRVAIQATYHSHHADFVVKRWYPGLGYVTDNGHTQEYSEGDVFFAGGIKWDGCSNWNFFEEGYAHFCELGDLQDISPILELCWDLAADGVEAFDK